MAAPFVIDVALRVKDILGLEAIEAKMASLASAVNMPGGKKGASLDIDIPSTGKLDNVGKSLNTISQNGQKASSALKKTKQTLDEGAEGAAGFANSVLVAGKRYAAFLTATVAPFAVIAGFTAATQSVVEFDNAMVKLSQILEEPKAQIDGLRQTLIGLSKQTGTTLADMTKIATTLAQAGLLSGKSAEGIQEFLEPLAKVPLLPTFENIDDATEGIIAALKQFTKEGLTATEVLDKYVAVGNEFAVTSEDIANGLKRGGGAFAAFGGTIDEFIALFTVMQETTREGAETIGTTIRTVATRLSRPITLEFLEGIGVTTRDANGQLLGLLDILKQVSGVFEKSNTEQKRAIGETLGGYRQISRVFAALTAEGQEQMGKVLTSSINSSGTAARNAATALESMGGQIKVLKAEFAALIQSLAQPLFIPMIKAATEFGRALLVIVDVIKPIIPLLAAMTGYVVGIKALSFAIKTLVASFGLLGGTGALGLKSIFGEFEGITGAATTNAIQAERIKRRLAGGIGGQPPVQASFLGKTGGVAAGAAGAIVRSPVGSMAALIGLNLAAETASESFKKAGSASATLAADTLKAATTMALVVTLLSGKSFSGIASVLGPLSTGLAAATIVLTGFTYAAGQAAKINIQGIIDAAQQKIAGAKFNIPEGNLDALGDALGTLSTTSVEAIQDSAKQFEGFSGYFAGLSNRIGKLLSGDVLEAFSGATITEADANKMIDTIIGNNPEQLNEIFTAAIDQFGMAGLETGLDQLFAQKLVGMVPDPQVVAQIFREKLITAAGGIAEVGKMAATLEREKANKKLLAETQSVAAEFGKIHVPSELSHELSSLSTAVGKAAQAISLNVQTFDKLSKQVGQDIGAPLPETEWSREAVKRIVQQGRMGEFLNLEQFPELTGLATDLGQVGTSLDNFFKSLLAGQASVDVITQLSDPQVNPTDVLNEYINEFIAAYPQEIPPDAIQQFRASAKLLGQSIKASLAEKGGILPDAEEIKKAFTDVFGKQAPFADAMVDVAKKWLDAQSQQINAQMRSTELFAGIDVSTASMAQTIINSAQEAFANAGVQMFDPRYTDLLQRGYGDMDQTMIGVAEDVNLVDTALSEYGSALKKSAELTRQVDEMRQRSDTEGTEINADLEKAAQAAHQRVIDLQVGLVQLTKILEEAPAALQRVQEKWETEPEVAEVQKTNLQALVDVLTERIQRGRQFAEAQVAVDVSKVFEEPAKIFAQALTESSEAVKIFTRSLTVADIMRGANAVPGNPVRVSEQAVQQQDTSNIQAATFGAPMERVMETLLQSATKLADQQAGFANVFTKDFWTKSLAERKDLAATPAYADIPDAIRKAGLDIRQVAELAAQSLKEQAQQPGAKQVDFIGAITQSNQDLVRNLVDLLQKPELMRRPEEIGRELPQNVKDFMQMFAPQPTGIGGGGAGTVVPQVPISDDLEASAQDIVQAASETKLAADYTVSATQGIQTASVDMATGGQDLLLASQGFKDGVGQLSAVMDMQREADILRREAIGGGETATMETGTQAMTEGLASLGERIDTVAAAIETQTQQAVELASQQQAEPIEIPGLSENTDALASNAEVMSQTKDTVGTLNEGMIKVASAIEGGVGIDVETMSNIKVDVTGVGAAAQEFTSDIEAIAHRIAKEEIRVILRQLAQNSGNSELAGTFETVLG